MVQNTTTGMELVRITRQWLSDGHTDFRIPPGNTPEQTQKLVCDQLQTLIKDGADVLFAIRSLLNDYWEQNGDEDSYVLTACFIIDNAIKVGYGNISPNLTEKRDLINKKKILSKKVPEVLANNILRKYGGKKHKKKLRIKKGSGQVHGKIQNKPKSEQINIELQSHTEKNKQIKKDKDNEIEERKEMAWQEFTQKNPFFSSL